MSTDSCLRARRRRQAGLTMVELIVFIVIVSAAVAGVLSTMSSLSAKSGDALERKQAILRAEALLEEVALAKFTFCHPDDANADTAASSGACATLAEGFGPGAGEGRPYFNVNDYGSGNGLVNDCETNNNAGLVTTDATGAPLQPAPYRSKVFVTAVPSFGPAAMSIGTVTPAATPADSEVLLITVEVCYGNNYQQQVVLQRYRTRYAPNSMP